MACHFGGMDVSEAKRPKALEEETAKQQKRLASRCSLPPQCVVDTVRMGGITAFNLRGAPGGPALRQISAKDTSSAPCLIINAFCATEQFEALSFFAPPSRESVRKTLAEKWSSLPAIGAG